MLYLVDYPSYTTWRYRACRIRAYGSRTRVSGLKVRRLSHLPNAPFIRLVGDTGKLQPIQHQSHSVFHFYPAQHTERSLFTTLKLVDTAPTRRSTSIFSFGKPETRPLHPSIGVRDGIRTHNHRNHNPVHYQLCYPNHFYGVRLSHIYN